MRCLIVVIMVFLSGCNTGGNTVSSVTNSWSWIGGTKQVNGSGTYGSQGVAAATNLPGARDLAISWYGTDGSLWLFGGSGIDGTGNNGSLNDLWNYNPQTRAWNWVSGESSINGHGQYGIMGQANANNNPGARFGGVSWLDHDGNLWLFGGFGYAEIGEPGALNDLWQFNVHSLEWTWVGGSKTTNAASNYGSYQQASVGNMPGARLGSVAWVDASGKFWLFGGESQLLVTEVYNDLWKYDPTAKTWEWVSGESIPSQAGVYGIRGIPNGSNVPGSRLDAVAWVDSANNLCLFGGNGVDATNNHGLLNDTWCFNLSDLTWTWMSGSNFSDNYGSYGSYGESSPNTIPGSRQHRIPINGTNQAGIIWMIGGDGYSSNTQGLLNDLWLYNPTTSYWFWLGGSNNPNAFSVYSNLGSIGAAPGARRDGVGWVDTQGNLWLFGGYGYTNNESGLLNDLWKLTIN